MISLLIGKTFKSLVDTPFHPEDKIILEPVSRFISKKPFEKQERKNRKNSTKTLRLYRIIYEDGIYKEQQPNVTLPLNYTDEQYKIAENKLLEKVLNNTTYITRPIKIKVKDVIKITISQLTDFWRYSVPFPEINSPSLLTEFQMRISYYLGYWLGDGTSESPGALTIGKEDQPEAEIVLKQLSKELNLKLTMGRNKKGLTCTLNKGKTCGNITASCLEEGFLEHVEKACKELEISKKKNISPYQNFQNLYDPVKQYKKGNDYYYDDRKNKYNTESIKKKWNQPNAKKNGFVQYMRKTVKDIIPDPKEVWSKKTPEEKLKYKLGQDKKDIIAKYKKIMKINSPVLTEYYKIWKENGVEGLQNIIDEQIKSISPIFL